MGPGFLRYPEGRHQNRGVLPPVVVELWSTMASSPSRRTRRWTMFERSEYESSYLTVLRGTRLVDSRRAARVLNFLTCLRKLFFQLPTFILSTSYGGDFDRVRIISPLSVTFFCPSLPDYSFVRENLPYYLEEQHF